MSITIEEEDFNDGSSTSATTATLTSAPSEGELIVIALFARGNTEAEMSAPSGFSTAGGDSVNVSGTDFSMEVYYKVAGASEGTSYSMTLTNSNQWDVQIWVVSSTNGFTEGTTLDASTFQSNTYSSDTSPHATSSSGALADTEGFAIIANGNRGGSATHSSWTTDFTEDIDHAPGGGPGVNSFGAASDIRTVTTAYTPTVTLSSNIRGVIVSCAFIEDADSGLAITPAAETVNITAGTLTISTDYDITPAAETVNVTAGTLTIAVEQFITPDAVTVNATAGTLDISQAQPITPAAEAVTITAGTLTITTTVGVDPAGPTVTATAGTLTITLEQFITPDAETVNVTAGSVTLSTATPVTPAAETVTITAGTLSLTIDIPLGGPTVTTTPGTVVVTVAGSTQEITPEAVTVTVTAGTLDVAEDQTIDPDGPTVTITAGTFTILLETSYAGPTVTATAGTTTITSDYPITPGVITVTATAGAVTLTGGNIIIYAPEAGNFYRHPSSTRLVLGIGPRRSMTMGLGSAEGWELVSEQFKLNGDDAGMQEAQLAVATAWSANSGAATAVLKAAIDQALQDAGYRRLNGTSLV